MCNHPKISDLRRMCVGDRAKWQGGRITITIKRTSDTSWLARIDLKDLGTCMLGATCVEIKHKRQLQDLNLYDPPYKDSDTFLVKAVPRFKDVVTVPYEGILTAVT